MNTPDQAPKNGDFVAYLADLERRQLQTHRPAGVPPLPASPTKAGAKSPALSRPVTPGGAALPTTTLSPETAIELIRSLPVGLLVVGAVLLIVGLVVKGGGFLVFIGALMLAQAVRVVLKAVKDRTTAPGQQVAALLAGQVQPKPPQK